MANYQTLDEAKAAIQAHPICVSFVELPRSFVVYYPAAYTINGGALVQRGGNDLAACNLLYDRIDAFWNAQRLQIAAE